MGLSSGGRGGGSVDTGGGLIFGIVIGLRIWGEGGGIHMGGLIYRGTY